MTENKTTRTSNGTAPYEEMDRSARDRVDRLADDLEAELGGMNMIELAMTKRVGRLGAMLEEAMAACLAPWELTRADYGALTGLRSVGEPYALRPTDLRQRILLSSGGTSNVLNRLAKAGLIEREPDASDGRSSLVRLTSEGIETSEQIARAWATYQLDFFRKVPADVCRVAADSLRTILIALGDHDPVESPPG
ncbi:MarR family transcriptional regulator [Nocardia sp. NPDC051911]|uniref:MarR family winged helix-turn-helix transcriptional regulator n=1 Tax=Nocardia sp. NPDC051911 TaxID=3154648 RepID=UPI00343EDEF3